MSSKLFDTIEFLKSYEEHPCLWNKAIPDFHNRFKRDAAEEKLLPISGLANIKGLRAKIRSIRGTYNQEVTKINKSIRTGSGANDIYKPKLQWFSYADSFLRKNVDLNMQTESNLMTEVECINETLNETSNSNNEKDDEEHITSTPPVNIRKRSKNFLKSNKNEKIDNSLDEAVKALREVSSSHTSNNEFNIFGQLIGLQLSKLPLEEALVLQQDIQLKINEARIRSVRNLSTISSSPLSTSLDCLPNTSNNIDHLRSPVYEESYSVIDNIQRSPTTGTYFMNWAPEDSFTD